MKKIFLIMISLFAVGTFSGFANDTVIYKSELTGDPISKEKEAISDYDVPLIIKANLFIPWAKTGIANAELVIQKEGYSLWKVKNNDLVNIPSCDPVGTKYHYFVYKNGDFLFTVNECNKEVVYGFFSELA